MTALIIVEGVVILLLLVLVAGLLKSHAEILRQLHRLGATFDSPASVQPRSVGFGEVPSPDITGQDLTGATRTVSLRNGRSPTLLAFLSSGCATCRVFWEELHSELEPPVPEARTVVVTKGTGSESPSKLRELAPPDVTLIMSDETWDEFRVPLTPYFLLVYADGRVIGEGSARNWSHLLSLLRQSAADSPDPARLDTRGREQFTDSRLRESGIQPGDHSLYENPLDR